MLDCIFWIFDYGFLNFGFWISGFRFLNLGFWDLGFGFRILDCGFLIFELLDLGS